MFALKWHLHHLIRRRLAILSRPNQESQVVLKMLYRQMRNLKASELPNFLDVGFHTFSQYEEDGILLFIFSLIGEKDRRVVEMWAGDGAECMATNLIINHGWEGYLFDGSAQNVTLGNRFFKRYPSVCAYPPQFNHAWITAENVNDLIKNTGVSGEVDLFSLDIDGNDYWVWKAIEVIKPRVCVIETSEMIPSDLSITIKYDPNFYCWDKPSPQKEYRSASIRAMVNLSREKGYRLIGANRHGFNCFFMRNDIGQEYFPEVSIESVHDTPFTRKALKNWPLIKDMDWVTV